MLKTNSKIVRERVRAYILEGFEPYEEEERESLDTFEKVAAYIVKAWRKETPRESLKDWLLGLPSVLYIEPYHDQERETLKKWLDETDEEANKYDSAKVLDVYLYLIARELLKAANN